VGADNIARNLRRPAGELGRFTLRCSCDNRGNAIGRISRGASAVDFSQRREAPLCDALLPRSSLEPLANISYFRKPFPKWGMDMAGPAV